MSEHPWATIPALIDAGVLTPQEAKDNIVLAHRSMHRRAMRELSGLLPELMGRGDLTGEGMQRIQGCLSRAQAEEIPDL